jgi:hypothetical protein
VPLPVAVLGVTLSQFAYPDVFHCVFDAILTFMELFAVLPTDTVLFVIVTTGWPASWVSVYV